MGEKLVALRGDNVEFVLPNGLVVLVWIEGDELKLRANTAITVSPITATKVAVNKR